MYTIFDVAKNFLEREPDMSLKKLQKLCWYAYSWYIALNNEPNEKNLLLLFNDEAEAWIHGPVFKNLYTDIRSNNSLETKNAKPISNIEILGHLNEVWNIYGSFTGYELESITQQEKPWINARTGLKPTEPSFKKINNYDVFEEYLNR